MFIEINFAIAGKLETDFTVDKEQTEGNWILNIKLQLQDLHNLI